MEGTGRSKAQSLGELDLPRFFPYRLAILAEAVSEAVAQLYANRFDLSRQEWRILAALGSRPEIAAKEAARLCALDKMQVSRASQGLEAAGLISRAPDPGDRRNMRLRLTPAGRALYERIVPLALAREAYLLEALTDEERSAFSRAMDKVLARSRELSSRG